MSEAGEKQHFVSQNDNKELPYFTIPQYIWDEADHQLSGLISQHQCPKSLIYLWLNVCKSLQPGSKTVLKAVYKVF